MSSVFLPRISVMQQLSRDVCASSCLTHSNLQWLYKMAWFSRSLLPFYWYSQYGCYLSYDEVSVLSAFVFCIFFWADSPFFKFSFIFFSSYKLPEVTLPSAGRPVSWQAKWSQSKMWDNRITFIKTVQRTDVIQKCWICFTYRRTDGWISEKKQIFG